MPHDDTPSSRRRHGSESFWLLITYSGTPIYQNNSIPKSKRSSTDADADINTSSVCHLIHVNFGENPGRLILLGPLAASSAMMNRQYAFLIRLALYYGNYSLLLSQEGQAESAKGLAG